jgi:hypothetical protein
MIRRRLIMSGLVLAFWGAFLPESSVSPDGTLFLADPMTASAGPQAGRVSTRKAEGTRESPERRTAPGAPPGVDASLPVLVTMSPADFEACGLTKLSPEELERLDRWIFKLLTMASVTPSGEIIFPPPGSQTPPTRTGETEAQRSEMQIRLNDIRQTALRLSNTLNYVRLALQRRDVYGAESYLFSAESDAQRILQAAR